MLKPYTIEEVGKVMRSNKESERLALSYGQYAHDDNKEWAEANRERILAERVEVLNAEQERAVNEKEYLHQEHVANWRKNDVALSVAADKAIQTVELMGHVVRGVDSIAIENEKDEIDLMKLAIECAEAVEAAFAYHGLPKP